MSWEASLTRDAPLQDGCGGLVEAFVATVAWLLPARIATQLCPKDELEAEEAAVRPLLSIVLHGCSLLYGTSCLA